MRGAAWIDANDVFYLDLIHILPACDIDISLAIHSVASEQCTFDVDKRAIGDCRYERRPEPLGLHSLDGFDLGCEVTRE